MNSRQEHQAPASKVGRCVSHTPGPWQFHSESVDPEWHIVTGKTTPLRGVIANIHIASGNSRDLADAHLIAAAPDLLAALRELTDACITADCAGNLAGEVDGRLLDAARAAIAKAEGRQ